MVSRDSCLHKTVHQVECLVHFDDRLWNIIQYQTGHFRASQTESPDKIRLNWLYVIEHNKIHTKVKLFMRQPIHD